MTTRVFDQVYKIELPIPFPLQMTNVYLIDVPPRTLVDTGIKTEASFKALEQGLKEIGLSLPSIERILITHGHIDHYGLANRISAISGAPVYIHPKEYERIRSILHLLGFLKSILTRNGVPERLVEQAIRFIETAQQMADPLEEAFFLEDGDPVFFESMTWKTLHCPGHSPGQICFHWPEKQVLFAGDHLLKEITPNPILSVPEYKLPLRYPSLAEYLGSLEKISRFDLQLVLPGHGEEVRGAKGLIQRIHDHHDQRMRLISSILADGERTGFEVAVRLFPGVPPFEVFLGVSEALGHLDILKERGKVRVIEKDGKDYYSLT